MVMNQITKLNLEPRIRDLKNQNMSEREIAVTLSREANQKITKSAVHRYLASHNQLCKEVIEKNDKLKVKVAELELDTVNERRAVIDKVKGLAEKAENDGDYKTALYALKISISALESLDERLGNLNRAPVLNVQINAELNEIKAVLVGLCPKCKAMVKRGLHELAGN